MVDSNIIKIRGTAVFPALDRPDTRFDENGVYKADVALDIEAAKPAMQRIAKVYRAHVGRNHPRMPEKGSRVGLWFAEEDDEGNETGRVIFKIRSRNRLLKNGDLWDRRPQQFDSRGKPIAKPLQVWGGSELVVACEIRTYEGRNGKGVQLQPLGVQIINLVSGEGGGGYSAADLGFGAEDGGFVAGGGSGEESDDSTLFDDDEATDSDDSVSAFEADDFADGEDY